MTLNGLLKLTDVLEAATGAALIIRPSTVTFWLLGATPSDLGAALGRVAGLAIVALAVACWPHRGTGQDAPSPWAMFMYSLFVALYLAYLGVVQAAGAFLWPAVAAHALFVILFLALRSHKRSSPASRF